MLPVVVLVEGFSVIGHQYYKGAVVEASGLERVEKAPELPIGVEDLGIVEIDGLLDLVGPVGRYLLQHFVQHAGDVDSDGSEALRELGGRIVRPVSVDYVQEQKVRLTFRPVQDLECRVHRLGCPRMLQRPIGVKAPLEAEVLREVGAGDDAVHLIPGSREDLGEVGHRAAQHVTVARTVLRRREARERGHVRRKRRRRCADGGLEHHAVLSERVDLGRRVAGITVDSDVIGAQTVERNQDQRRDVRALRRRRENRISPERKQVTFVSGPEPRLEEHPSLAPGPGAEIDFPIEPAVSL